MKNYNKNYIVILVCDNIPNQKFWNEESQDWTHNLERATVYPTYGDAGRIIWSIPKDKISHRVTSSNKEMYELYSSGKWDGYSKLE